MPAAGSYRGDDVVDRFGYDYAYRNLAIIGAVSCVQCAASVIETNFAPDFISQLCR
jgi:hypothetical protein